MQATLKYLIIILTIILGVEQLSYAQSPKADSLSSYLKTAKEDTNKVNTLNMLGWEYFKTNVDTAIVLSNQGLSLAHKLKWLYGESKSHYSLGWFYSTKKDFSSSLNHYEKAITIAEPKDSLDKILFVRLKTVQSKSYGLIGTIYYNQGNYPQALENHLKAFKIDEEIDNKAGMARHLTNIGNTHRDRSNYLKSLNSFLQAQKIYESMNDKKGAAMNLGNIGIIYFEQKNYENALNYYNDALKINFEIGNQTNAAANIGNIGLIHVSKKEYDKALDCYFKALAINTKEGNSKGRLDNLDNIGSVYNFQKDYFKALLYYSKAKEICDSLGAKENFAIILINTADVHRSLKQYVQAEKELKEAVAIVKESNSLNILKEAEKGISELYNSMGNYEQAYIHYMNYVSINDSLNNVENAKKQTQMEMQYDFDKKEAIAKAEQDKKDILVEEEKTKQQIIIYSISTGLLLLLILAGVIFRSLRINKEKNKIISIQKEVVEEKQKEILDSIRYAKRIQSSLLPTEKYMIKSINRLKTK